MDLTLLNRQKQSVFELFKDCSVDPLRFRWGQSNSQFGSKIRVSKLYPAERSEFWFVFDNGQSRYYPRCSPWTDARQATFADLTWESCLDHAGFGQASLTRKSVLVPIGALFYRGRFISELFSLKWIL